MSNDSFIHACAGGAGGVIAMTATYPLLTISTRAAVQSKQTNETLLQSALKTVREEGVVGLYSGLNSSLIGIAVTNFVYYFFFEKSRDVILKSKAAAAAAAAATVSGTIAQGGALSTLEAMLAGLIAGSATTIISNPIWVINTRQTVRAPTTPSLSSSQQLAARNKPGAPKPVVKRLGFVETLQHILRTDGVAALWRGIGPALVLVINPILQYTVFEQLKNWVVKGRLARGVAANLTDRDFFLLGALSKLVATGITYPQIVIKSRQQSGSGVSKKKTNVWTAMTDIVQHEGIAGLYRGISSKLLQSVLTAAILFASKERVFEITKRALAPAVKA